MGVPSQPQQEPQIVEDASFQQQLQAKNRLDDTATASTTSLSNGRHDSKSSSSSSWGDFLGADDSASSRLSYYQEPNGNAISSLSHRGDDETAKTRSSNDSISSSLWSINNNKKPRRRVSFGGTLHIRQYERILDVNPGVTNGPPIGIGWNFMEEQLSMKEWNTYKKQKQRALQRRSLALLSSSEEIQQRHNNNSLVLLKLTRQEREHLLLVWGFRPVEISQAVRSVLKAQHQRSQTVRHLHHAPMEEVIEGATRKVKKLVWKGLFGCCTAPSLYNNNNIIRKHTPTATCGC